MSNVTASAEQIYITQGSQTPDSVVVFYQNSISYGSSYTVGSGVELIRYVDPAFESTDEATITDLLANGATSPCSGVAVIDSSFDHMTSCLGGGIVFSFRCLTSSGATYQPSLTQSQIASLDNPNVDTYSFTFGGVTKTFDKSYMHFEGNTFSHILVDRAFTTFSIQGFHKINFESKSNCSHFCVDNDFDNNGFYITSILAAWSNMAQYFR